MPDISPDYLTLFPAGNINIGLARMPQLSRLRFVQLGECLRLGPTLTHLELASDRISVGSQSRDKAEASLDISIQVFGVWGLTLFRRSDPTGHELHRRRHQPLAFPSQAPAPESLLNNVLCGLTYSNARIQPSTAFMVKVPDTLVQSPPCMTVS
ncbi:hypothetical protein B0H17DRAFT_1213517 [Mycena rosella]|uniref:Uncharacterized protein n=1 Tax=Mycena rosella TaxID=1033263 RepID=A0AAD7CPY0_MYCRO|nr:hypothetical protein B0H17DRAFT_1213517 [Mycena rosella]